MVLSDLCIRRPVLATVLSLVVVLLGIVCYERLSVREYPKIDEPVVTVETKYRVARDQGARGLPRRDRGRRRADLDQPR
jgi:multidrug efflux pump